MPVKLGHTANLNGIGSTEQRSLWCREHWLANTDSERWCQLQQATTKVTAAKHGIHGWMNEDLLVHVRATDKIKPIVEFQQLGTQLEELTSTNLVSNRHGSSNLAVWRTNNLWHSDGFISEQSLTFGPVDTKSISHTSLACFYSNSLTLEFDLKGKKKWLKHWAKFKTRHKVVWCFSCKRELSPCPLPVWKHH